MLPSMTSEVIFHLMDYLCQNNVSLHIDSHPNWSINECASNNLARNYTLVQKLNFTQGTINNQHP